MKYAQRAVPIAHHEERQAHEVNRLGKRPVRNGIRERDSRPRASDHGIALVPECVARTSRKAVPVRLRSRQWRTIGVASLKSRYLPPLAGRFVEDLLHRGIRSVSAYTS